MSVEEYEASNYRPFNQIDYYNAEAAFKNMVELKIMTAAEMEKKLKLLRDAVKE